LCNYIDFIVKNIIYKRTH